MSETKNSADRDVLIEGHTYDGIQEYDNPMPGWWLAIFYITIAWSVYYVIGITVGWINSYEDDLHQQNLHVAELRTAAAAASPDITAEYLAEKATDPAFLAAGEAAFAQTCSACHGPNGGGTIGPNLTDDHLLYGGSLMEIYEIVDKGLPAKGMPAWGPALTHERIVGVVAYVDGLRGTHVAGGKEPEGEEYVPE